MSDKGDKQSNESKQPKARRKRYQASIILADYYKNHRFEKPLIYKILAPDDLVAIATLEVVLIQLCKDGYFQLDLEPTLEVAMGRVSKGRCYEWFYYQDRYDLAMFCESNLGLI